MSRGMRSMLRAAVTLLAPIALAGLGACDLTGDHAEVLVLIDDAIDLENDAIDVVCDCWSEMGLDSRGECLDGQILPSQRRCVEDAYLRDADASRMYLECVVPLIDELGTCLDERLSCNDPAGADPCFDDYDIGAKACIDVPASVRSRAGQLSGRVSRPSAAAR